MTEIGDPGEITPAVPGNAKAKGAIVATYEGAIVLRDPNPHDVSRASRPLIPEAPTVAAVERQIARALGDGFAVTVRFTRTDR